MLDEPGLARGELEVADSPGDGVACTACCT